MTTTVIPKISLSVLPVKAGHSIIGDLVDNRTHWRVELLVDSNHQKNQLKAIEQAKRKVAYVLVDKYLE